MKIFMIIAVFFSFQLNATEVCPTLEGSYSCNSYDGDLKDKALHIKQIMESDKEKFEITGSDDIVLIKDVIIGEETDSTLDFDGKPVPTKVSGNCEDDTLMFKGQFMSPGEGGVKQEYTYKKVNGVLIARLQGFELVNEGEDAGESNTVTDEAGNVWLTAEQPDELVCVEVPTDVVEDAATQN